MKRLEKLPQITDEMLGGLEASQALKADILRDAKLAAQGADTRRNTPWQKKPAQTRRRNILRAVSAMACLALLLTGALAAFPGLLGKTQPETLIDTQTAGDPAPLTGGQSVALDMPRGSIVISQRGSPSYRGVWEAADGANFPLIGVDGRWYRMMSNPTSLGSDLTGDSLGAVSAFTSEPALASGGIVSNVVPQGETVYAVRGMEGAAVAASVNGSLRVFQRVSFGASALKNKEKLADTLGASPAVAMELTGVGTVTDPEKAQELFRILLGKARLERASASETKQTLLIAFQNGLALQMNVRDESLMACGTWVCPEFFEAFEAAVE